MTSANYNNSGMSNEKLADKSQRSIFVGNIPYEATEEKLVELFNKAGPVLSFRLVYDRENGKPKGYGFCEYQCSSTASSALRNLQNIEFNGRPLRIGPAAGEQNSAEIALNNCAAQNAPPPLHDSPYGDPVEPSEAPKAISQAVASLAPEQMYELMKQIKLCIQDNQAEARNMLLQNPQLAYAILQAQIIMKIVDPKLAIKMLTRTNEQIPPITSLVAAAESAVRNSAAASSSGLAAATSNVEHKMTNDAMNESNSVKMPPPAAPFGYSHSMTQPPPPSSLPMPSSLLSTSVPPPSSSASGNSMMQPPPPQPSSNHRNASHPPPINSSADGLLPVPTHSAAAVSVSQSHYRSSVPPPAMPANHHIPPHSHNHHPHQQQQQHSKAPPHPTSSSSSSSVSASSSSSNSGGSDSNANSNAMNLFAGREPQEKKELVRQVMRLPDEHIAKLPEDQKKAIELIKEQFRSGYFG